MPKESVQSSSEQFVSLEELLSVDARNLAHRPDGTIMSNYERHQIEDHENQIIQGLIETESVQEAHQPDIIPDPTTAKGWIEMRDRQRDTETPSVWKPRMAALLLGVKRRMFRPFHAVTAASKFAVEGAKSLEIGQKSRAVARITGVGVKNHSSNAAAWTVVAGDKLVKKETYTDIQDRVTEQFNKAQIGLLKLRNTVSNMATEQRKKTEGLTEEQRRRRRIILNGAMGAMLVGAVAYRAWHGLELSGGGNHNFLDALPEQDQSDAKNEHDRKSEPPKHDNPGKDGNNPGKNDKPDNPESKPVPQELSLDEQGSSIWSSIDDTANARGVELSDVQTHDLVSKTLQHNNLTWEEARHLPVDYQFDVPEEVRRAIEEEADED